MGELAAERPFDEVRRGYPIGTAVLTAILPPHDCPTVVVPVRQGNEWMDVKDGSSLIGMTSSSSS
ncbi:MAG: hypothetical protein HHJ11_18040 [Phycicoccus sp.]|nr:hypothetical protein [Phycicoccus sp.]NMM35305.1 hypothetical protein [Phycicoccus sp.]